MIAMVMASTVPSAIDKTVKTIVIIRPVMIIFEKSHFHTTSHLNCGFVTRM